MAGRHWTKEEVLALRQLAKSGCGVADVAGELGRSAFAVRHKSARLGGLLGHRGVRPQARDLTRRAQILDRLAAGERFPSIACALGVSVSAVGQLVRAMVREGLVVREGGKTRSARYRPAMTWA